MPFMAISSHMHPKGQTGANAGETGVTCFYSFSALKECGDLSNLITSKGKRQLHGLFYMLAVTMVAVPKSGRPNHPVFHRYYMRKISKVEVASGNVIVAGAND